MFIAMHFRRVIVSAAVFAVLASGLHAEVIEQVLVKVNGDIITKTDFEERQVAALRQRNVDPQTGELQKLVSELTPQLILEAVDETLLIQRGRDLGYKMTDEMFSNIVQQIRKENKLDDDAQFEAALRQEGMSMDDLRKSLERQMLIARTQQQEVGQKLGITESEAQAYYEQNKSQFTTPARVTLREIQLNVPKDERGINVAADEQTKARIEEIRKRAQGGESFEQLAGELSDSASKANGGLIGPLAVNELSASVQEVIAKLKPGDISEPLRTPQGYQILKLESRTEDEVLPFDQARDQIADRLYDQKRRIEMVKYLETLRERAIIEWKNEDLKRAYETALARRAEAVPDSLSPTPSAAETAETPPTR